MKDQLTLPLTHVDDQWVWDNFERFHPLPNQVCPYSHQVPTWVYRIQSLDDFLYVGCTAHLPSRLRNHQEKFWWLHAWKVVADLICCRAHALEYEAHQIRLYYPKHNKARPARDRFFSHGWVIRGCVGFDKDDL